MGKLFTMTMGIQLTISSRAMEVLRGIRRAVFIYPGSRKPIRKLCRLGSTEKELLKALVLEIEAVR